MVLSPPTHRGPEGASATLIRHVLDVWPEHRRFLDKAVRELDDGRLADELASAVLRIAGDRLDAVIAGYRWMCEMMLEEEIHFRRSGTYRHSNFAEVAAAVYLDSGVMTRYMDGLLVSQALWPNHHQVFRLYRDAFLSQVRPGDRHLEIDPGHGLLLYYAAQATTGHVEAWDISASAIETTKRSLLAMGMGARNIGFRCADFMSMSSDGVTPFDRVVISEVLEHLERPDHALEKVRSLLVSGGRAFVNVPVNSPSLDHIYHFRTPAEVVSLVERAGLSMDQHCLAPSGGYSLERAVKTGTTISCAIIASKS
jgi:2-polyprenyl-3-methyl-5-hydroxy-6-metoxy-1,4-benzoquinol methylase